MRDEFDAEDFCTVVFDEFFLALIANDNVVRHLLRLLKFVHTKVSSTRLENLMKLTEPTVAASSSSTSGLPSSMAMLGSSGNVFQARRKVQNFRGGGNPFLPLLWSIFIRFSKFFFPLKAIDRANY